MTPNQVINGKKAQQLASKGAQIIDMRSPVAFRDGTIPGARNLTLRRVSELFALPKNTTIVFLGETVDDDNVTTAIKYLRQTGHISLFIIESKESWNVV